AGPAGHRDRAGAALVGAKPPGWGGAAAPRPLSPPPAPAPESAPRHRGALGITEDTDAVSVVVSEERGEISLCFKGSIARDLEPVLLRRALVGLFAGGRATADMAEEAEAAAEVGKALAALGDPRPDPLGARDAREPRDARIDPGSEREDRAEAMR